MPPIISDTSAAAHIPAWKRIGLKLKNASDTAPAPAATADTPPTTKTSTKKRRRDDEDDAPLPTADAARAKKDKKIKKQKRAAATADAVVELEVRPNEKKEKKTAAAATRASTPPSPPTPSHATSASPTKSLLKRVKDAESDARRKSVTFAADVKATDGDSIKQMYLALDPFGKNRTRGGVNPPVNASPTKTLFTDDDDAAATAAPVASPKKTLTKKTVAVAEKPAAAPASPEKPAKIAAKNKHRGGSNSNGNISGAGKPYLDYLSNFLLHRTLWKFEKAKQNWILKNALSPELIPEASEKALAAYVAGLQGAAARERLLEEVKTVLKEGEGAGEVSPKVARARVVAKVLGRADLAGDESESDSDSDSSDSEEDSDSDDSDSEDEDDKKAAKDASDSSSDDDDSE